MAKHEKLNEEAALNNNLDAGTLQVNTHQTRNYSGKSFQKEVQKMDRKGYY